MVQNTATDRRRHSAVTARSWAEGARARPWRFRNCPKPCVRPGLVARRNHVSGEDGRYGLPVPGAFFNTNPRQSVHGPLAVTASGMFVTFVRAIRRSGENHRKAFIGSFSIWLLS